VKTRDVIRKDAEAIREIIRRLEDLEGYASVDDENLPDLEKIGSGYLAIALRLERVAARFNNRGAAYLGIA
jgi:hypothetical protein